METHNYKSATDPKVRPYVEQQILEEIAHDRYGIASSQPHIVSAPGALAKNAEGTKFRPIDDASRPTGQLLKDLAVNDPFKYQSIQDAVKRVKPGYGWLKWIWAMRIGPWVSIQVTMVSLG